MRTPRLLTLGFTTAALLGVAHAQPDVRDHRDHGGAAMKRPPPPNAATAGPSEAPPSPREEKQAARAGFVWITGKWDWNGKWDWTAGHWERERAGKQWRQGHWDRSGASWVWTEGAWTEGSDDHRPQANDHHPHQAPPPSREENHEAVKAGFVWQAGRWDWKNDQWAWLDGHWERERAHKKWRRAQWENRDNTWVLADGDWVADDVALPEGTSMQPPPRPDGDHDREHGERGHGGYMPMHEWKLERPTVSSYWPGKGKAGARVMIRGRNFGRDTRVMWGPQEVRAARITEGLIQFQVPPDAQSATILLKGKGGHDLIVGNFEVANYDADAEARRIEADRIAAAQAAWSTQQAKWAKDQATRQAALDAGWQEREQTRERRREQRIQEIRARWQASFLADLDTQSELTLHAERTAELTRARDVASVTANQKLGVRIDVALGRENDRHDQRMGALQAGFSAKGGAR
ncbi:hypothetical protein BH11MYX1_BH11MYX1_41530 [soil metagenome]